MLHLQCLALSETCALRPCDRVFRAIRGENLVVVERIATVCSVYSVFRFVLRGSLCASEHPAVGCTVAESLARRGCQRRSCIVVRIVKRLRIVMGEGQLKTQNSERLSSF